MFSSTWSNDHRLGPFASKWVGWWSVGCPWWTPRVSLFTIHSLTPVWMKMLACRNRELEGGTPSCMHYPMSKRCEHTQGLPLNWLTIGQLRASTLPVKWKLQRDRKTQVVGHCQLSWSVANYWLRGHLCRRAMIVRIDVEMYIQRKGTLGSPFCMMTGSKSFRAPICRLIF